MGGTILFTLDSAQYYGRIKEGDITESAGLKVCNNEKGIVIDLNGEFSSNIVEKDIEEGTVY